MSTQFHEGEQRVRNRAHLHEPVLDTQNYFRMFMPAQHRELFEKLPFVVIAALDNDDQPWATLLEGSPGFVAALDETHLRLHATLPAGDRLAAWLQAGAHIGLLGIEPQTRRRNRANGVIEQVTSAYLDVQVLQSFGNCPKYIQARTVEYGPTRQLTPQARRIAASDPIFISVIDQADTFFIASAHPCTRDAQRPEYGIDVSHRGGQAGFVQRHGDTLLVDDYVGNTFFNTLGNLELNPRAGLLFVDMQVGALLQVAVRTEIEWLTTLPADRKATNRRLHFHVEDAWYLAERSALQWGAAQLSPFL